MKEKNKKLKRGISFVTASVDDWLDDKKKLDGAEGLWRIHDKLYDFTVWSRIHPGGKFWLDVSRGTDITEAFEIHHFSNKAELLLQNYYKREALVPRNVSTTFHENGFYKVFKRKLSQQQLATTADPSLIVKLLSDSLATAVFLTGFLGAENGINWIIASGILLGILSTFSHNFIHMKDYWRMYYFNLCLMSSRDWKIRHVLSHLQYRNTLSDLEVPTWQSISEDYKNFRNNRLMLNILLYPFAAHLQFFKRCLDVFLSKKLRFHPEELVAFSLPLFLFVFSGVHLWEAFLIWNFTVLIGSFVFCLINFGFYKWETQTNSAENTQKEQKDFGMVQLSLIGIYPNRDCFKLCFLNSCRGNVLHYLCPVIRCGILDKVVPVFEETIDDFGISYAKNSKHFLEGLQDALPQGHVFFS